MKVKNLLIVFLLLVGCNVSENQNIPFEVGWGVADITPPIGFPRYGYPPVMSTGVKDSLYAKAIVFKQGEKQGALLICNLLGIPRDLSRIVRERVSLQTGIPFQNISVSATHTHTSPGITEAFKEYALREMSGKLTEEDENHYFTLLIERMTAALISAAGNTKEVEFFSGIGQAPGISFNRRYLMTDGRVRFNPGRNNPKIVAPAGPVDPEVHFILFRRKGESEFSGSLSTFASHYVRGGTEFSSDYPFFLEKYLRELFGDKHISLFGLGACGNVNTVNPDGKGEEESADVKVEKFGKTLAEAVEKSVPSAKQGKPDLEVVSKVLYLPMQDYTPEELCWSKEDSEPLYPEQAFLSLRRKLKISIWGVQPPLEQLRIHEAVPPSVSGEPWHLPVEIHAFRLDTQTAIVTMPGELFTEFGIDLKKRSPFPNTILIELADADIAYIPTVQAFKEGSYETINSRLMPGGGEEMINQAVKILEDLR